VGALVAALVGMYLFDYKGPALSLSGGDLGKALVVEFLFSFALCYVVLNVATSKDHADNSAVAFGATVAGLLEWSSIWIYLVANLAAGAAAGVVFKFVSANDP
jgi:aquaporin Z